MTNGLKALRNYKDKKDINLFGDYYLEKIEKDLIAYDVIRNKKVDIPALMKSKTPEDYNKNHNKKLAKKEFKMLKKELL